MNNLFFAPMIPGNEDILISGNVDVHEDGPSLDPESEHLSCFIGGLFALGTEHGAEQLDSPVGRLCNRDCELLNR